MKRYHVVIQLYAHGIWREHMHAGRTYAFRLRRDAERCADNMREIYPGQRWHVAILRRTVK